jgi:HK97 family phage major capsid protein
MNLQEIMNQISTLGGQIRTANAKLAQDCNNPAVSMDEIEKQQASIADMQKRMNAMQQSYDALREGQEAQLQNVQRTPAEPKSKKEMRASNEYVRAFCYALANGINPRNGLGNEKCRILYDAMSETGGDPAGEDGGFLVPIDIDNAINELRRELNPLAPLFNEETVSAPTGWRVMDTAPSAGFSAVDELGTVPTNDQPLFVKVPFSLTKYGLRLPVSNELMKDEAANLMNYISNWFARKLVLTENGLLLTALKTLTASALTSGTITPDSAIKTILNKTLDPAISASAVILTNQSGFDALDQLTDEMGRGLLQPDPTNATLLRMYGRRVVKVSDAQLPNLSTNTYAPFFIGDPREFATLFRKEGFEVASTDIGGDAWAKDSTEVRGIVRLGVSKFDTAAIVGRKLALS